ncbi:hypothetical protein [Arthrobacter sp.]|uniref:hypothetical protein n=1 Tax=Arthrobacter sp. TaxID=1667 RepID=UPI003394FE9A
MAAGAKRFCQLGSLRGPLAHGGFRRKGGDIVVKVLADGQDPRAVKAGELGQGKPLTIGADDGIEEAVKTMQSHQVRRSRTASVAS